jgi:hypothetical protein
MNPRRLPPPRPGLGVLPTLTPSRTLLSSFFCPLVASVLYRSLLLLARAQVTIGVSSSTPALLCTSAPTIFTTKASTPLPPSLSPPPPSPFPPSAPCPTRRSHRQARRGSSLVRTGAPRSARTPPSCKEGRTERGSNWVTRRVT